MTSLTRLVTLLALLAFGAAFAPAKDGRDFAGFYSLDAGSPEGGQVHVTLTLQVFNYSGADLEQATLALRSGPPEDVTFATYDAIREWRDGADVRLAMHFTVPQEVYERWRGRRQPAIVIMNRDQQGQALERLVQASRRTGIDLSERRPAE